MGHGDGPQDDQNASLAWNLKHYPQNMPLGAPVMNPTILLLDDSKENLVVMQRMLKRLPGMETVNPVFFTSGREALIWCRENEPDICVVDFNMPGMSGIDFLIEVRQLPRFKGIPMIMVTGSSDREIRQRALMSGANDFITRPVNPDEFRARLGNLLTLRMSLVNPLAG